MTSSFLSFGTVRIAKMFTKKTKRPSSARRNIRHETFSPFVSQQRLRNIQSVLHDGKQTTSEAPDALLCILGIDSRYNPGCTEFSNYLLFDFFNQRRRELEESGHEEETIDDVIIVVRANQVDVYCNPVNYAYLLPYVAHWRNLHIHCLQDEQYEDEERAEEFKISSFIAMVDGCSKIGVPFSSMGRLTRFDKMLIEKWPIIQAFALEEIGGGGFFTLKYEVMDVTQKLAAVYEVLDPVTMEVLLTEQLPLFVRQWETVVTEMDLAGPTKIGQITEQKAVEPLRCYFSHGRVGQSDGSQLRHPFVLYGTNSGRMGLKAAQSGAIASRISPDECGLGGKTALHMVMQSVSPRYPISCTRTYFFSAPFKPYPVTNEMTPEPVNVESDIRLLTAIYEAVVEAVLRAIEVYASTLSPQQSESAAMEVLSQHGSRWPNATLKKTLSNRKLIDVSIQSFDNHNRRIEIKDGEYCGFMKTASVTVFDVPSVEHNGKTLGSVSFSETFLDSAFTVTYPDGSSELESDSLILTSHVPRFIHWPVSKDDQIVLKQVKNAVQLEKVNTLGQFLSKGEEVHMLSPTSREFIRRGEVYFYENGVVYMHKHLGAIVLAKDKMTSIDFYDGDSPSVVALLMLTLSEDKMPYLPPALHTDAGHLALAFLPKTSAYKAFFSEVLSVWRGDEQKPKLEMAEEIPEEWQSLHCSIQKEFDRLTEKTTSPMKIAAATLTHLDQFKTHFEVTSCINGRTIPSHDVAAVLDQTFDAGAFNDDDELILTIIGGVPGSHKENLCNTVTKMSKDDNRWAVFRYPLENVEGFSASNLQNNLASALAAYRRRKPGTSKKKMRAVILTPGFTDIVEVVQAIYTHPDKNVQSKLKIGAITVCIDPLNVYLMDRGCLPRLLDQCAQGWVNNIVFTCNPLTQTDALSNVQELVRAINSDVALLLAERGEVTRTPDMELILSDSAFSSGPLVRARHLSCPGWSSGHYHCEALNPEISDVLLRFSQPLDKQRLFNKLKGLKLSHRKHPFHGNVYGVRGKFRYTASETPYELHYVVLSNDLTSTPGELTALPPSRPNQPPPRPYIIVFTGTHLQEDTLKTWLRECAPPKPEKKLLRTKKSLTQTEIKQVHAEHHLEPLPEGWFYNGSQYVSLDGEKSKTHPHLDRFLEKHLSVLNKEVEVHNNKVEALHYKDIFD